MTGARERSRLTTAALGVIVAVGAVAAVALHRNGHDLGDDFSLYLRQARSIFDGDTAQVVADNRFAVLNSDEAFSPIAYPWLFPLLLSPFVRWWGLDYDRLKLVEVACLCAWLVVVHGIVRRRSNRLLALAVVAVMATSPALLGHTDELLSEIPHALAVGVFIWWFDRIKVSDDLIVARTGQLVTLGLLAAVAYNVRRESIVLLGAIVIVQFAELWSVSRADLSRRVSWPTLAAPHAALVGAIVGFQLLLPSMLFPDTGDGPGHILGRLGDYAGVVTSQLGLGHHPAIGTVVLLLAVVGIVIGCVRRPRLDVPLAAVAVLSTAAVSTHFQMVDRYYFQVMPWVLYFGAQAVALVVEGLWSAGARRVAPLVALAPLLFLVGVHTVVLPGDIGDARDFDRGGRQQFGPTDPTMTAIYDAVDRYTRPDAVIAYFRSRTMTLLTDRRSFQTTSIAGVEHGADYFAQLRASSYSQPPDSEDDLEAEGFFPVWADSDWILWRVPG